MELRCDFNRVDGFHGYVCKPWIVLVQQCHTRNCRCIMLQRKIPCSLKIDMKEGIEYFPEPLIETRFAKGRNFCISIMELCFTTRHAFGIAI
jgi:hypothetical protein